MTTGPAGGEGTTMPQTMGAARAELGPIGASVPTTGTEWSRCRSRS
ncbi:hypothetical protein ACFPM0_32660 [Pseudonocardia sulfidoxydans]